MSKYTIYLTSTVSAAVEVEADSYEDAVDLALEEPPYAPGFADYEFNDEWEADESYALDGKLIIKETTE